MSALREIRLSRMLTQAELAQKAKVGKRTVWNAENGRLPRMRNRKKLLKALRIPFEHHATIFSHEVELEDIKPFLGPDAELGELGGEKMTDQDAIKHLVRLGMQGKREDCEMLAMKLARRLERRGDIEFAAELKEIIAQNSVRNPLGILRVKRREG